MSIKMLTDNIQDDDTEIYVVDISLECPYCDKTINTTLEIGLPDFSAEYYSDSASEYDDEIFCDHCNNEISLWITSKYHECFVDLTSYPKTEVRVSGPYFYKPNEEYEWAKQNTEQMLTLDKQLTSIRNIMNIADTQNEDSIYPMLFGHTVACFEGYLQLTFIHLVAQFDIIKQNLLETNKDLNSERVLLTELSKKPNYLNNKIQDYLENLTFHNIPKIAPIFKGALGFVFEEKEKQWIGNSVYIRHDCVHRGGINIKGEPIHITKDDIVELIKNIKDFTERFEAFLDTENLK